MEKPRKAAEPKPSTSEVVFGWIFTFILVVLFVRFMVFLYNLVFNFSDMPVAQHFRDGFSFDFGPRALIIQLLIIALVAALIIAGQRKDKQRKK